MIGWIITESNLKTERKNINSLRFYKRFSKVIEVTPLIEVEELRSVSILANPEKGQKVKNLYKQST